MIFDAYFYGRSLEDHFPLAENNPDYLKEKEGKLTESIQYYIDASKHKDEPLVFKDCIHYGKRLEISKIFIICFMNLKLTDYYSLESNFTESQQYFIKAFSNPSLSNNKFQFPFYKYQQNMFSYLRIFNLSFPLFNLTNQPHRESNDYDKETRYI
ncbi:hypothetical protein M9Y10_043277 [Tritrichomonas musculus]|uniref:Uncharacterized protein n=1 Tax=Tritrichomonas musculus TaxID=1915356 RepID=A0ABR2JZ83_9EUKA